MEHETSAFEAMPLELLVNVLSNMSTPEDVLATIKASPAALNAFMTGPERIYAVVLETCLSPEIFRELLAIVNAPDHNNWLVPLLFALPMCHFDHTINFSAQPKCGTPTASRRMGGSLRFSFGRVGGLGGQCV